MKNFINLIPFHALKKKKDILIDIRPENTLESNNSVKTFKYKDFESKNQCTAYLYGKEKMEQNAYICTKCDKKSQNYICEYCYNNCHKKCKIFHQKASDKKEFLKFSCYCGLNLKHTNANIEKIAKFE